MKALAWFWVAGCILVGLTMGQEQQRCGAWQQPDTQKVVATVATWPVILGYWAIAGYQHKPCDGQWGILP